VPIATRISARTGEGVDKWLAHVLGVDLQPGRSPLTVDYARYMAAEAALAWLNWHVRLHLPIPMPPALLVGPLADELDTRLSAAAMHIVHVKILDQTSMGGVRVSLCANGIEPLTEGALDASPAVDHDVLINARVIGDPDRLSHIVAEALESCDLQPHVVKREAFRPSAPKPERWVRFDELDTRP
jgi:hypothetical protein